MLPFVWSVLKHIIVVVLVPHQADFQDVPFVLELARHHSCSSTVQVCPQTGFPVWPVPALGASHPALGQAFLSLNNKQQVNSSVHYYESFLFSFLQHQNINICFINMCLQRWTTIKSSDNISWMRRFPEHFITLTAQLYTRKNPMAEFSLDSTGFLCFIC